MWVIILSTWEGAYRVFGWRAEAFPAPSHVLRAAGSMLNLAAPHDTPPGAASKGAASTGAAGWFQSPLARGLLVSLVRLVAGFGVTVALGVLAGMAMWRSQELDKFLGPLFLGMQTLPSVCWVPLAVLTVGADERGVLFVVVMGSVFAVALSMRDGLRAMPPLYRRAGLMMGAAGWKLYRYVLLPASMPAVTTSLRQGFSFAWRSLMGAEVLFAVQRHGLGHLLGDSRDVAAGVVAVMAVMVLVGMIADRWVFAVLQQRVDARFGLAGR